MNKENKNGLEILDYFRVNVPTIPQMFYNTVENAGSCCANTYKSGKEWKTINYDEWAYISEEIALSLIQQGVKKGDDIAIMSKLSAPRAWADMAILIAGAVSATITPMVSDGDLLFIINRSDIKFIFVENKIMLQRVNSLIDQMPSLKGIICLGENFRGNRNTNWNLDEFRNLGKGMNPITVLRDRWQRLNGDDPARLNYTISTNGQLRCSLMKHRDWVAGERKEHLRILSENLNGKYNDIYTSIMPMANIKERTFGFFSMVAIGAEIKFGSGPSGINTLQDIRKLQQKKVNQIKAV